jgi:hypothetical protein
MIGSSIATYYLRCEEDLWGRTQNLAAPCGERAWWWGFAAGRARRGLVDTGGVNGTAGEWKPLCQGTRNDSDISHLGKLEEEFRPADWNRALASLCLS